MPKMQVECSLYRIGMSAANRDVQGSIPRNKIPGIKIPWNLIPARARMPAMTIKEDDYDHQPQLVCNVC